VDGAFKTPGLRNVELTAPFFHNGGDRTLMDAVNFYNRGGNSPRSTRITLTPHRDPGSDPAEKQALVALMVGMTDERCGSSGSLSTTRSYLFPTCGRRSSGCRPQRQRHAAAYV